MLILLLAASVAYGVSHAQDELKILIARYEWPGQVSADAVLQIPQVRRAVSRFLRSEDSELIIRYPGGDEGNQWAIELHDILVALGIRSKFILLEPGSGVEDTVVLIVAKKRGA